MVATGKGDGRVHVHRSSLRQAKQEFCWVSFCAGLVSEFRFIIFVDASTGAIDSIVISQLT
jgi:hypothetical protein